MYTLNWLPPYDWQWMFGFLGARAVTGIETVTHDYYERSFACEGHQGIFRVTPDIATHTLTVTLSPGLIPVAQPCLERIERLFDLACNPQHIAETLGDLGAARPGLRLPGAMDAYEQGVRAILGQLVSVAMAAKLASRVVALCGEPVADCPGYLCFPTPQALAAADPLGHADKARGVADSSGAVGYRRNISAFPAREYRRGDEGATKAAGDRALDGKLSGPARLAGERCVSAG